MAYSTKLTYNKQRIKKDGSATLYIQVLINREKEIINLDFSWPVDLIQTLEILPRNKEDKEHADWSIEIKKELGKINEIFRLARLADKEVDKEEFRRQYRNFDSREDFLFYFEQRIKYLKEHNLLGENTLKAHGSTLQTLKQYCTAIAKDKAVGLKFHLITKAFLERWKAWMYNKKNYDSDTARTKLKNVRRYLKDGEREGHVITPWPFDGFKMPDEQSTIEHLSEEEFSKILKHFKSGNIEAGTAKERSLRAFIFMCYTGLRLGDIQAVTHNNLKKNILSFQPQKNSPDMQKTVDVPLISYARKLIITKKGKLFDLPSEAMMRKMLNEIRTKLEIQSKVSPHVARHTFATRFLAKGGRIEVLQQLLGHEKITTTMIYTHVTLERKITEISYLES